MSFNNLQLIEPILKALQTEGYTTPTPIQEQSIPIILLITILGLIVSMIFALPQQTFIDWGDALYYLSSNISDEPTTLLFDEISWMGSRDPTFLSKIKNLWDTQLKNNNKLIFVVNIINK